MHDGITVVGGGPAGSLAALAALASGANVTVYEQAQFPKHKVCGEFLSPEAAHVFREYGLLEYFLKLEPVRITEARVTLGTVLKSWPLRDPAFGISRFALDRFLLDRAADRGAIVVRERAPVLSGPRTVLACGRQRAQAKGRRLFGFKAHFSGPPSSAVDLVFARDFYLGLNSVENGCLNVCALVSEALLKRSGFDPEQLIFEHAVLRTRLRGYDRVTGWLFTGPLVFGRASEDVSERGIYPAGDALGFVDPFTGSGMVGALCTGALAGRSSAAGIPCSEYLQSCRRVLRRQYAMSSVIRVTIAAGVARLIAPAVPGRMLFALTRPNVRG